MEGGAMSQPIRGQGDLREGSIGAILQRAGKLSEDDLGRIIQLQREENILFGDAAVRLGLLTDDDVRWALSSQYSYPYMQAGESLISPDVLAVHSPFSPPVEALRSIRSGLVLSGVGRQIKTLALVSPGPKEGRSFVAANLATVFAQSGSRTLLIDLDFRAPRLHELFQLSNKTGISALLIHRTTREQAISQTQIESLSILPSGPKPPNPLELLSWPDTRDLIESMKKQYDVVIIDTPPSMITADALMITALCDAAVLVAMKGTTRHQTILAMKKQFADANMRIVGTVLNEYQMPSTANERPSQGRLSRLLRVFKRIGNRQSGAKG